jgi:hypothetical protein
MNTDATEIEKSLDSAAAALVPYDYVFAWNTGRAYSDSGQRVGAKLLTDRRVAFYDVDRMIDGVTEEKFVWEGAGDPAVHGNRLQRFVMTEYDHGRYTTGIRQVAVDDFAFANALREQACALPTLSAGNERDDGMEP